MKVGKKIKRFFKKRPLWKPLSAIVLAILVLVTMQAVLQSVKAEMEQAQGEIARLVADYNRRNKDLGMVRHTAKIRK